MKFHFELGTYLESLLFLTFLPLPSELGFFFSQLCFYKLSLLLVQSQYTSILYLNIFISDYFIHQVTFNLSLMYLYTQGQSIDYPFNRILNTDNDSLRHCKAIHSQSVQTLGSHTSMINIYLNHRNDSRLFALLIMVGNKFQNIFSQDFFLTIFKKINVCTSTII